MKETKLEYPIAQYSKDGTYVKTYFYQHELIEDRFNVRLVRDCCRGYISSHKGYIWKYKN